VTAVKYVYFPAVIDRRYKKFLSSAALA